MKKFTFVFVILSIVISSSAMAKGNYRRSTYEAAAQHAQKKADRYHYFNPQKSEKWGKRAAEMNGVINNARQSRLGVPPRF